MKILYTRAEDGGVSIVGAAPKQSIEEAISRLALKILDGAAEDRELFLQSMPSLVAEQVILREMKKAISTNLPLVLPIILTEEEYKKHIWERSVPKDAINPVWVEDSAVLKDREFRDAWKQNDKVVEVDLPKAKDIQLGRLRVERNKILDGTDKEFTRALEASNTEAMAQLKIRRQALRDATEALKALDPKSVADIKNATPDVSKI